jgi:hypothetical protein
MLVLAVTFGVCCAAALLISMWRGSLRSHVDTEGKLKHVVRTAIRTVLEPIKYYQELYTRWQLSCITRGSCHA